MRLTADDISSDARLLGMIAFLFACFGAGTPQHDDFAISTELRQNFSGKMTGLEEVDRKLIAPRPFVARLPQRLLGHPKGGALAVVGHVDRAWGSSFLWEGAQQVTTFESALTKLLKGDRVGFATEDFNNRYAGLSTELTTRIEDVKHREPVPPEELAGLWTANNDARSYIVLGDPAVRLAVAQTDTETASDASVVERPVIEVSTFKPTPEALAAWNSASPTQDEERQLDNNEQLVAPNAEEVAYGFLDRDALQQTRDRLVEAVQIFVARLGDALERAVDNASTLEVSTYVSDDMPHAAVNPSQFGRLAAYTRIAIDGDTTVCVPETEGAIDRSLWAIHLDMVQQAQANRAEMIKAGVSAASSLLDMLKGV